MRNQMRVLVVALVLETIVLVSLITSNASTDTCSKCPCLCQSSQEEHQPAARAMSEIVVRQSSQEKQRPSTTQPPQEKQQPATNAKSEILDGQSSQEKQRPTSTTQPPKEKQQPTTNATSGILDICPEVYKGLTTEHGTTGGSDDPLDEHGWEFKNCANARPLESVVTILINAVGYTKDQLMDLIRQIRINYHFLNITIAHDKAHEELRKINNVQLVMVESESEGWMDVLSKSETKYSVVLRDVYRFTNYTKIERLVSVAFRDNIPVVGGASVGFNGHWWDNCYQIQLRNYVLRYKHGYKRSTDSCLVCDHITGPFLARTSYLKQALSHLVKESDTLFEDMFLHERKSKGVDPTIVACPDVMFHVDAIPLEKQDVKRRWLPLAKRQELTEVATFTKTFKFDCDDLGIRCPSIVKGMANAPCCQKLLAKCVKKTAQLAYEHNLLLEVRCGTLMGAVKMGNILPWELDADMHYYNGNHSQIPKLASLLNPHGCHISNPSGIEIDHGSMSGYGWSIDFTRMPMVPSLLYKQRTGYNYTFVLLDGEWVRSPPSPGLNIFNKMRTGMYKHILHRAQIGTWFSSTGSFPKCPYAGHHNCLDQFVADGNLQFTNPDCA